MKYTKAPTHTHTHIYIYIYIYTHTKIMCIYQLKKHLKKKKTTVALCVILLFKGLKSIMSF